MNEPTSQKPERYQHRGTLGRGGSGEVIAAWDTALGRTVAIKRLRTTGIHDEAVTAGLQEAMRLAAMHHPSIVSIYDMGQEEGAPFIVMEYLQGETLDVRVQRGPMGVQEFAEFARQTLSGLVAAHQAGLVHRDIKPTNLMLVPQPCGSSQVKILDFGLAKFVETPAAQTLNRDGTLSGSLHYIAPEQIEQDPVDGRSDLYALGCVFYFALTGRRPFSGDTVVQVIQAHLQHLCKPLAQERPDLPLPLCEWIHKLMSRYPDERQPTATRALDELEAALPFTARFHRPETASITLPPHAPTSRIPVSSSSRASGGKMTLAMVAVLLLGVLGAGAWFYSQNQNESGAALGTSAQAAPAPAPAPIAVAPTPAPTPVVVALAATPASAPVESSFATPKIAMRPAEPTPVPTTPVPEPPAPAEVVFRAHGSNTIGAKLMPALMEDFLKREGATQIRRLAGSSHEEMTIEFTPAGSKDKQALEIHAHGSNTALADLVADRCDLGMVSRPIKNEEVAASEQAGLGNMHSPECEHVIALDGLAIIVNRDNPVAQLTRQQVGDIFAGRVNDWSAVGGPAGPIHCYARDPKSGTTDTFRSLVLGKDTPLAPGAHEYEDSAELASDCAKDPAGIGFVGLPYIGQTKAVAIHEAGVTPLLPTRFTVATEDYLLSRRLFLYAPARPQNPWTSKFVSYVLSDAGQEVVSRIGFVKQTIDTQRPVIPAGAPETYVKTVAEAERLSLDFRFRPGSTELDAKGARDLDRLINMLTDGRFTGRALLLLGFSDNTGQALTNVKLAKERASAVAKELLNRGVEPAVITGIGPILPVASNDTEDGRHKNRRVEVWLKSQPVVR